MPHDPKTCVMAVALLNEDGKILMAKDLPLRFSFEEGRQKLVGFDAEVDIMVETLKPEVIPIKRTTKEK